MGISIAVVVLLSVPLGAATATIVVPAPDITLTGPGFHVVNYRSTVDGFNLSYAEWLPKNFSKDGHFPLIVFLHGQQDTSGAWFDGGLPSTLVEALESRRVTNESVTTRELVDNASRGGYILIAVNSRSGAGWYVNSPCGGPQAQDTFDAIQVEKGLHHIRGVYLVGISMGTEGVLSLTAARPDEFSGIAIVAPVTDMFMDEAYREALAGHPLSNATHPWAYPSLVAKANNFCGVLAGTGNASERALIAQYVNMSPLRFNPTAFQGIPIYVTAGSGDDQAPNSAAFWPSWLNVNNTFVSATCTVAAAAGEPKNCSVSLDKLHLSQPTLFSFRYIWEPGQVHTLAQLDPSDLLAFWEGKVPGGFYTGVYPFPAISNSTTAPAY